MIILLLDESLRVQIFYEGQDAEFKDNICISFQEDCPEEEKIFKVDETNIYLTPEQAQELADALNTAAAQSKLATRAKQLNERRFDGDVDRLRSIERRNLLEVDHVVKTALESIEVENILDVGTGSGLFAESFAERGLEVAGLDISAEMVESARRYVPEGDIRLGAAEDMPYPDNSFDLVFMGLLLHETDDPEQTLREARRVARKRVVVLEWPYKEGQIGPPLEHRLSPDEIKVLTRKVGFPEVESIQMANTVLYCMKV